MKLLIDIGNSDVKWCTTKNETITDIKRAKKKDFLTTIKDEWQKYTAPQEIRISNVSGEAIQQQITDHCQTLWGKNPYIAKSTKRNGKIINNYQPPENLGIDRWLAVIAAYNRTHDTTCIIDFGTATTIDIIDNQGTYQGGYILPSYQKTTETLTTQTANIPPPKRTNNRNLKQQNPQSNRASHPTRPYRLNNRCLQHPIQTLKNNHPRHNNRRQSTNMAKTPNLQNRIHRRTSTRRPIKNRTNKTLVNFVLKSN